MSENLPAPQSPSTAEDAIIRRLKRQRRTQTILRILGFPGMGLGIALTVQQIRAGQLGLALLTGLASLGVSVLALFAKFFSELGSKVLDRIEERLEETTDSLADWIVAQLESSLVRLWWQITPQFRGAYYESLIYECRNYKTQGLKTPDSITPDLEKVFVPLRVAAKGIEQISPALIQRQEARGKLEIWDFLAESQQESAYRRMVIIGAPGSGKSTLLQHITLTYAYNSHRQRGRKIPTLVPILLPLHAIREQITATQPPTLPAVILTQVKTLPKGRGLKPAPQWFDVRLDRGQCLVMLDGLDEVADETQRRQVSDWVDEQMRAYPDARWILTSRPYGYRQAPLTEARITLGVQPFSLGQMEQFLRQWYLDTEVKGQRRAPDPGVRAAATEKADDLISRVKNYPPLAAMALNPLLLTMIATVHKNRGALPGSRVDLYDEICDVLLVRRQEAKRLVEPLPLRAEQKKLVLQALALALMMLPRRDFRAEQGEEMIADALTAVAGDQVTPRQFLTHVETVSGLLLEREVGVYQFAHLSFQEFLAAEQVKETGQVDLLINQVEHTWWHETIRLYAAQSDTTALVEAALKVPGLTTLTIAYDCLEEGKSIAAETRRRLEALSLEAADPAVAKLAAEVKLARRLARFLRIDEAVQIDPSPITQAEFQLFLRERQLSPGAVALNAPGQPVTGVSLALALEFCRWLAEWAGNNLLSLLEGEGTEGSVIYRLPTLGELERVPTLEGAGLSYVRLGGSPFSNNSLRLVKEALPLDYGPLYEALTAQAWEQADQLTANFLTFNGNRAQPKTETPAPQVLVRCQHLRRLDHLWALATAGQQGLGIQVGVWLSLAGTTTAKQEKFAESVGWHREQELRPGYYPRQGFSVDLLEKLIGCGLEPRLPLITFDTVRVDAKGQIAETQPKQAPYFSQDLGNGVSLDLVAIPGGEFWMGQTEAEKAELIRSFGEEDYQKYYARELPRHQVKVPGFWLGKYAVTQAQWRAVAKLSRVKTALNPNPAKFKGDNRPVEQVSWDDAIEFCARLSRHTQRDYRLPSEAEWEYACRAGTETPFSFGETITPDLANYNGNYPYGQGPKGLYRGQTTDVGSFPPNGFGLYDMHGNVWEWCLDFVHGSYKHAPTDGSPWLSSGNKKFRLLRGGSWYGYPRNCRSAYRNHFYPGNRGNFFGFRVVCEARGTLP